GALAQRRRDLVSADALRCAGEQPRELERGTRSAQTTMCSGRLHSLLEVESTTGALHERCTPQLAHAGGGERSARVPEFELREQSLPGAEVVVDGLDVRPQRLGILGGHDRLAQPVVEVLAL